MSILYIRRFTPGNSWDVWPYHLFRDRYRYYRPSGKFWNFKGRSGFFRSSLHRCFKVTEKTFEFLYSGSGEELKTYDALVINSDYYQVEEINSLFDMGRLEEINTTPKILFVSADYSDWLPREQILSQFDLIFKREVWEDRSRYEIPGNLQSILHPTMLGCPLTNLTKFNLSDFDPKDAGHREPNEQFNRNVFFLGPELVEIP